MNARNFQQTWWPFLLSIFLPRRLGEINLLPHQLYPPAFGILYCVSENMNHEKKIVFIFKYETVWTILLLHFLKCVQNSNLEAIDIWEWNWPQTVNKFWAEMHKSATVFHKLFFFFFFPKGGHGGGKRLWRIVFYQFRKWRKEFSNTQCWLADCHFWVWCSWV